MEGFARRRGFSFAVRGLRSSGYDGKKSFGEECEGSMDSIMRVKKNIIDCILYCVLFILPFIHINIGINVSDQGYNLANFEMFPNINETWGIATLAANLIGKLFTQLPFGHYTVRYFCRYLCWGYSIS